MTEMQRFCEESAKRIRVIDDLAKGCKIEIPEEIILGCAHASASLATLYGLSEVGLYVNEFLAVFLRNLYKAGYQHGLKDGQMFKGGKG